MPRGYPHSHECHGHFVGYSIKMFGNESTYYVCFRSKDGRRLKRDTNQTGQEKARRAGEAIIEKEYEPAPDRPDKVSWDAAVEKLTARLASAGIRPLTVEYYLKGIRLVRKMYSATDGPADISPGMAKTWRDTMMVQNGRRKKPPSAHYVAGLVTGLSALWQKWFLDDLAIVQGNPWQDVEPPKTDKLTVKYATDEQIEAFYSWVAERFGDWPFPKLFLSAKAYTACRLMDLCSLKSAQLVAGRLVFPALTAKGRKERRVPLPADLFSSLDAFKGKTWLWENYLPGLKEALQAKGWPTHRFGSEFSPQRLYHWVEGVFADYRKAHPDRPVLTTHMFRKRAFTLAWNAGIDPRRASIAYGCNVDTLMKHYVSLDEQEVTDGVFHQMNGGNGKEKAEEKAGEEE
jgi:integrase